MKIRHDAGTLRARIIAPGVLLLVAYTSVFPVPAGAEESRLTRESTDSGALVADVVRRGLDNALGALQAFVNAKFLPTVSLSILNAPFESMQFTIKELANERVAEDSQPLRDSVLVYSSAGLKGMTMVMEGIQTRNSERQVRGWTFCEMALQDMESLRSQIGGDAGGSEADSGGIGSSLGFNLSGNYNTSSSGGNLGISYSRPLTRNIDYGIGANVGLQRSSFGSGTSAGKSSNLSYGGNVFSRYNFLGVFKRHPSIVPFLGIQGGVKQAANSFSSSGMPASSSKSTDYTYGGQGGILFFFSQRLALNLQVEDDFRTGESGFSVPGSPEPKTTTTSTILFSLGLRVMF